MFLPSLAGSFVGNAVGWVGSKVLRRTRAGLGSPPLRVRLYASTTYATELGVLAIAPTALTSEAREYEDFDAAVSSYGGAYLSPTPFVVVLENTSDVLDPRPLRITELRLKLKTYWPLDRSVQDVIFIQSTTIQAGGRGSEGSFVVVLRGESPIEIPLFQSAAAESGTSARGMRIDPSSYAEIEFQILLQSEGRYTFEVSLAVEERGHASSIEVADNLAVLECGDWSWANSAIVTFNWTRPRLLNAEQLQAQTRRWLEWREHFRGCCPPPDGQRRVKVCGEIDVAAWG